jgi:AbrB family looped-hinge helix DNA binding protein
MTMAELSKVTRNFQITLPVSIRKKLGIEEGDIIEMSVEDEKVVLAPKKLIDKSQAYFWTKQWQEAEKQAEDDISEGRIKSFGSADELVDGLEDDTLQP